MVMLVLCAATLCSCVQVPAYVPKVDLRGFDAARYRADLEDCRKSADMDRYGPVLAGAVVGASLGAGMGSVLGWAVSGDAGLGAGYGAASGAGLGGATGFSIARNQPADAAAIDDCLKANGYKVEP